MKNGLGMLKKILLLIVLAAIAGGGYYAYTNPEIRSKLSDAKWIYDHQQSGAYDHVEWRDGQIVKVLDGNWVFVKIPEGFVYGLRIRGLLAPTLAVLLSDDTLKMGKASKAFLEELALRKDMRFQPIDMGDNRYGQGYIEFQGKSIVLPMIQAGMARLNREELTHFSKEALWELLRAEYEARQSEIGIWDPSLDLDWTVGDFESAGGPPGI